MLDIRSPYSSQFNEYLIKKIKADLRRSAFSFNDEFVFFGKLYSLKQCIDSLQCSKGKICFALIYPIKHLIYNNRQFYWKDIMEKYSNSIDEEYFLWRRTKH